MGLEQTANLVTIMRSMGAAEKRRAVPRSAHPMRVEEEYGGKIAALIHRAASSFDELRSAMPRLLAASQQRYDAGESDIAAKLIAEARAKMGRTITQEDIRALATFAGERTSQAQRAALQKQIKAGLGIDVPLDEARTRDLMKYFVSENAQQIGSIPVNMQESVANLTMRAFSKRMNFESYEEELHKLVDISEGKARFIARDQIGTLNGQLTEIRHTELGITHYTWETLLDANVRPVHQRREQKRFAWAAAPAGGHPGIDYGCRCGAKPDLSGVLAAIAANQAHGSPAG